MRVGELYHHEEHGLIVVRKVSLTHQSINGSSLYKVVFHVFADGNLWGRKITRHEFHAQFTSL